MKQITTEELLSVDLEDTNRTLLEFDELSKTLKELYDRFISAETKELIKSFYRVLNAEIQNNEFMLSELEISIQQLSNYCEIVVQYLEKTRDGRLRFPSFKELKEC